MEEKKVRILYLMRGTTTKTTPTLPSPAGNMKLQKFNKNSL